MFLSVDIGNTHTTIGLFSRRGEAVRCWRMPSQPADTADTLRARLHTFFTMDGFEFAEVTSAGVASVVPPLSRAWQMTLREILSGEPLMVSAGQNYGMRVDMPDPTCVGADRIANAIAAIKTYGAPVIVVDFGTATNIDVVDQAGAYRGGAISPGLMLSANALFAKAAKLSSIPVVAPVCALGDTTEKAIQSGLVIGAATQAEAWSRVLSESSTRRRRPSWGRAAWPRPWPRRPTSSTRSTPRSPCAASATSGCTRRADKVGGEKGFSPFLAAARAASGCFLLLPYRCAARMRACSGAMSISAPSSFLTVARPQTSMPASVPLRATLPLG